MLMKDWKKELLTIPNLLSLFRLVLIPVYVVIYVHANSGKEYFLAAAILGVSCLTDLVDGKIARHFNMVSTVGKILDPLADKATQFTLILCLALKYKVLWYLIVLFVIKESFQLVAGGLTLRRGVMLKGALLTGKICTAVLFISLIIMVMIPSLPHKTVNIIAITDSIFMIISFADYLRAYFGNTNHFQSLNG